MKSFRCSLFRIIRITATACIVFFVAGAFLQSLAAPGESPVEAQAAARAWVAQIDAGQYEESYLAGCIAFHEKITKDKWVLGLKAVRAPHGAVVSRSETSHVLKPNGYQGLDGECMIIEYDTSFKNLPDGTEEVVMKHEDGIWKGAGYTVGSKTAPDTNTPSQ